MRYPLFGLGVQAKSPVVSAVSRKNLYLEISKEVDKTTVTAYGTAGLDLFTSFGETPVRGNIEVRTLLYVVHRGYLYELNTAGVKTIKGTLLTLSGRLSMATNGNIIQIVDGQYGYTYNIATDTFAQISDADFVPAFTNTWIDGYFITDQLGSTDKTKWGRYSWSDDGSTYSALDFANAESNPDSIVRVYNDNRELILFGEFTTEFNGNSGAADAPFTRQAVVEWGLAARWSIAKMNNSIIYLGKNNMGKAQVIVLNAYTPQVVTDENISAIFDSYGDVSNASGYSYMLSGHPMYVLSFPNVGKTWMYDGSNNTWCELTSGLDEGQYFGFDAVNFTAASATLVFDYRNGNVYKINPNSYTDNGSQIVREMTSKHVFNENYISISKLWIDMETGVGIQNGQGKDPQLMLETSKDGGRTYGNSRMASFGRVGAYLARAIFYRFGASRDFVFRLRITDPVKLVITGAYMEASK